MSVHRVRREPATTFCEYCGEVRAMGRHAIPADLAASLPKEKCSKCKTEAAVACTLGLGHFVYVCEKCGNKWSNIE